jgi:hypothetical protein
VTAIVPTARGIYPGGGIYGGRGIFLKTSAAGAPTSITPKSDLVAYLRVSTDRQGRSGLGLEAQRVAIVRFAEAEGFPILTELVEVETGKGADALERRPMLREALALAKKHKASVCAAKLDRLSRDRQPDGAQGSVHRRRARSHP